MDEFDRQILKLMQDNLRRTSEEMGDKLGLSPTSVQRRLKKLRTSGMISREVAILDSDHFDEFVTIIVEIVLKRGGTDIVNAFKKKALSFSQVQQCYYVAGNNDFILIVNTKNMEQYEAFCHEWLLNDESIHIFRSNVAMSNVKLGLNIPI